MKSALGLLVLSFVSTQICLAKFSYPIVDTHQEHTFDERRVIPFPKTGEPFDGQDAQYAGHRPKYLDNGDGTISDMVTGLMWTRDPGEERISFYQATAGAETCRVGGYTDWRLPSIKELYSLIQFNGTDPDPRNDNIDSLRPFIDHRVFGFRYGDPNEGRRIIDAQFASSTLYVGDIMNGREGMFGVNFADGRIKGYATRSPRGDGHLYALFVRDNPEYGINKFKDMGNGTIMDEATGLTWLKVDSGEGMDWKAALDYAESMEFAGYSDWRLPSAKELQSIIDYGRSPDTTDSAAIDPVFQATAIENEDGKKDYGWYWTSTTHKRGWAGNAAVYLCFGRSLGFMPIRRSDQYSLLDVHGAGAQRSDPKQGDASRFPRGRGPQGDVVRIDNLVRLVRGGNVKRVESGPEIPDLPSRQPQRPRERIGGPGGAGRGAIRPAREPRPAQPAPEARPATLPDSLQTAPTSANPSDKPNIVFIYADDMGWTGTSVEMIPGDAGTRSDYYQTPNLEKLAAMGMRFSAAYAPSAFCTPSRAAVLTGKTPAELHITSPGSGLGSDSDRLKPPTQLRRFPESETSIAEALDPVGYTSAYFGKWHLGRGNPGQHGFQVHDGSTSNDTPANEPPSNPKDIFGLNERAMAFMEKQVQAGRPFYAQLFHYAVHAPNATRPESRNKFRENSPGERHRNAPFAGMTWDLDRSIGTLMEKIEELGIVDRTYIVFMSDNGAPSGRRSGELNNAPLNKGKSTVYEGGIRVPLIIAGPGIPADSHSSEPVTGCDLFPTFCQWAGVEISHEIDGTSLASLLSGKRHSLDRQVSSLLFHYPHYGVGPDAKPASAIISGSHKLIKDWESNSYELFNLAEDLGEQNDLADSHPGKLRELTALMEERLRSANAQVPTINPDYDPSAEPFERRRVGRRGSGGRQGGGQPPQRPAR